MKLDRSSTRMARGFALGAILAFSSDAVADAPANEKAEPTEWDVLADKHLPDVWRVLVTPDALRGNDTRVVAQLRALGPRAIPAMFVVWNREQVMPPAELAKEVEVPTRGQEAFQWHETCHRVTAAAMSSHSSDSLVPFLRSLIGEGQPNLRRIAALRLAGTLGQNSLLPFVLETMKVLEGKSLASPVVTATFQKTIRTLAESSPSTVSRTLRSRWKDVHWSLHRYVFRGIAQADVGEALSLVNAVMGRDTDTDRVLVTEALKLIDKVEDNDLPRLATCLRLAVRSDDSELRRLGAQGLGSIDDLESFETVLWLLEDEDPLVRKHALATLKTLSGHSLPPNPEAWQQWWTTEQDWYLEEGESMERWLLQGNEAEVLTAIRVFRRKRMLRKQVEDEFALLLEDSRPNIQKAAEEAWGQLTASR